MTVLVKLVAGLGGLGSLGVGATMYLSSVSSDGTVLKAAQRGAKTISASWDVSRDQNSGTKWDFNWDRRDPSHMVAPSKGGEDDVRFETELEMATPTAVRNIFLIRHGQYNINGKTDKNMVLTETGVEQAKMTGKRLAALNFPYELMARSTMTRAQQTGEHILGQLKPNSLLLKDDTMLEEGAPCPPEPEPSSLGYGYAPMSYEYFQDGSRIEAAFRNYICRADLSLRKDSYELVVCHGNVIRYFVCRALQLPPEAWLRMDLSHASITWLCISPNGGVSLRCLGDSGHLPPNLLT